MVVDGRSSPSNTASPEQDPAPLPATTEPASGRTGKYSEFRTCRSIPPLQIFLSMGRFRQPAGCRSQLRHHALHRNSTGLLPFELVLISHLMSTGVGLVVRTLSHQATGLLQPWWSSEFIKGLPRRWRFLLPYSSRGLTILSLAIQRSYLPQPLFGMHLQLLMPPLLVVLRTSPIRQLLYQMQSPPLKTPSDT